MLCLRGDLHDYMNGNRNDKWKEGGEWGFFVLSNEGQREKLKKMSATKAQFADATVL